MNKLFNYCKQSYHKYFNLGIFSTFVGGLWNFALIKSILLANQHNNNNQVFIIGGFYLLTIISSLPVFHNYLENLTNKNKKKLKDMIFYMYSFESLALTTVGLGMYYDSNLLKIIGVGITCQFGQIYKIHRKSTGTKALNLPDRLLLTSGVFGHHLGTFLFINNNITLGFLTAWRFFSISGHSLALLKDKLKVSKLTLDIVGWTRVFFCLGIFQPIMNISLIGHRFNYWDTNSSINKLAIGLRQGGWGIISYILFRGIRMHIVRNYRVKVGLKKCNTANFLNTYGRQKYILEYEIFMLYLGTLLLI